MRVLLTALLLCVSAPALAQTASSASASAGAEAPSPRPALRPLPKPPSIEPEAPLEEYLIEVDDLLKQATSSDAEERAKVSSALEGADPKWVSALLRRLNDIAEKGDRPAMKAKLEKLRKAARQKVREQMRKEKKRGKVVTPDYFEMLTGELAQPDDRQWQDVTKVVTISRALRHIGTVEAGRALIHIYVRYGEFLRVDTQLQLEKMGDRAIAPLVEARRHEAGKIASWAERQLDLLGKAIPSEAVQTPDQEVLADVLRAYGRIKDPDAARIIVSFCNTERAQVRLAARQAVVLMGEVANWALRDNYQNLIGKTPPRDWSWDRVARELFGELDRLRLAQVYELFDRGKKAASENRHQEAKEAFDKVLAMSPLFERRGEMAASYYAYAKATAEADREAAHTALRRAQRLSADDTERKRIESLRLTLEGERLLDRGFADQVLFRRAIEADSSNTRAKEVLERIQRGEAKKEESFNRYFAAGAIGLVALIALVLIGLRGGKPRPAPDPKDEAQEQPPQQHDAEPSAEEAAPETHPVAEPAALEAKVALPPPEEQPVPEPESSATTEPPSVEPAPAPAPPSQAPVALPPAPEEPAAPAAPEPAAPAAPEPAPVRLPEFPQVSLPKPDDGTVPAAAPPAPKPAAPTPAAPVLPAPAPEEPAPLRAPQISLPPLADDDD